MIRSFAAMLMIVLPALPQPVFSQDNPADTLPEPKHAAIIFPYPMYREKWRSAIGLSLMTTPEEVTEEVRLRIPAIDFRVMRRINDQFVADGRITAQILQNQLAAGLRWMLPISNRLYLSVGDDVAYWFGFLKIEAFDSKGSGWFMNPHASLGYRTKNNLLITLRAQPSVNIYYRAYNGKEELSSHTIFYNGEAYTIALEQPFYHHTHIMLSFSAIYNYFNWQTWSLFYRTDRKIFYPQVSAAFIL